MEEKDEKEALSSSEEYEMVDEDEDAGFEVLEEKRVAHFCAGSEGSASALERAAAAEIEELEERGVRGMEEGLGRATDEEGVVREEEEDEPEGPEEALGVNSPQLKFSTSKSEASLSLSQSFWLGASVTA